jgi:acyl-CoA dehydrogenase
MPNIDAWEEKGQLPKDIFIKFGEMGFFGLTQEEKYGGSNLDFWYDVIFIEEVSKLGVVVLEQVFRHILI